jgi:hypothetical protein
MQPRSTARAWGVLLAIVAIPALVGLLLVVIASRSSNANGIYRNDAIGLLLVAREGEYSLTRHPVRGVDEDLNSWVLVSEGTIDWIDELACHMIVDANNGQRRFVSIENSSAPNFIFVEHDGIEFE